MTTPVTMDPVRDSRTVALEQSATEWEYIPSLLELMDEGLGPDDLASREFVVPRVAEIGSGKPGFAPEGSSLRRLMDWLRGFRYESSLYLREPIWIPIAEVWAAPGGSADFTYATTAEHELQAEITVFSVIGVGGSSKRTLDTSVELSVSTAGVMYETRAYLSIYRYSKASTGKTLYRVDVDCTGAIGEFQSRDLDPRTRPFSGKAQSREQLQDAGYVIGLVEGLTGTAQANAVTIRNESRRSWKFEVSPKFPGLDLELKLGANCERAESFETKFTLPAGRNYAFCGPRGDAPVVPLCVALT